MVHYNSSDFDNSLLHSSREFTLKAYATTARKKLDNFSNYLPENDYSLEQLLFVKKRMTGYVTVENDQREIRCASGYYPVQNCILGGVRALSIPSTAQEHKFFHAAYILNYQLEIAKKQNATAFIIAINLSNKRIWNLMKFYAQKSVAYSNPTIERARHFFRGLQYYETPIQFNSCKQNICYYPIKAFYPESIDGFTYHDHA